HNQGAVPIKPSLYSSFALSNNKHLALFIAFPNYRQRGRARVIALNHQRADFGPTQPASKQYSNNRRVACTRQGIVAVSSVKKLDNLIGGQAPAAALHAGLCVPDALNQRITRL